MKKRGLAILLAGSLALMLVACGSKDQPTETADAVAADTAAAEAGPEETTTAEAGETKTSEDTAAADTATADADVPAEDIGKYMIYEYEANGQVVDHATLETAGMGETYLDLQADGKGELMLYNKAVDVTWKKGIVTVYGTSDYTYTRDGDTLTLDMQGVIYTMIREGGQAAESAGSDEAASDETADTTEAAPSGEAPGGDGIVSEEQVQKGYVWMSKINEDIFNTTYEDLVAYFGVEGKFEKEEYNDHMEQNRRYYFWISSEDDTHFIYVNFGEKDPEGAPGVYKITGFNSSGFSAADAEEKYLEELQNQ